jgi:hypothetical protein
VPARTGNVGVDKDDGYVPALPTFCLRWLLDPAGVKPVVESA